MKKLLLATVALVGLTTASFANPTELAKINKIEPLLLEFIYKHTNYDPHFVPEIRQYVFKTGAELNLMYYGVAETDNFQVQALYDSGVVFLIDTFTVKQDAYVLLHELVHHVQFNNAAPFECVQEMEAEAYDVMDAYVRVSGNGELTDRMFRMFLSCKPEMGWR